MPGPDGKGDQARDKDSWTRLAVCPAGPETGFPEGLGSEHSEWRVRPGLGLGKGVMSRSGGTGEAFEVRGAPRP